MKSKGKSRSDAAQKPVLINRLAGAVLVLVAAVAVGIAIRGYRFWSWERQMAQTQKAAQPAAVSKDTQTPKQPESPSSQEQPTEEVAVEPVQPAPEPVGPLKSQTDTQANSAVAPEAPAAPAEQSSGNEDLAAKERRGREALALVGHDPAADAVWIQSINDPTLSASARSNLIEDLNEDGLQYRNLTTADLPVIQYRLELIEDLRPYAMDKTNADAFDEARKDLVNMERRLTGR